MYSLSGEISKKKSLRSMQASPFSSGYIWMIPQLSAIVRRELRFVEILPTPPCLEENDVSLAFVAGHPNRDGKAGGNLLHLPAGPCGPTYASIVENTMQYAS